MPPPTDTPPAGPADTAARDQERADTELDAIAAELYALAPEQFTAARNARATASDRMLAARVKALRKPTTAAWAVDLLAREGQLADALELAAALRAAQDDLDAVELARLSRQRRALVAALAAHAVDLARNRGVEVSAAAAAAVERTINAAVMDASAAAAVMTARLVHPLEATGFDAVDVSDAVGGSIPGLPDAVAPTVDDLAERRARKAAERALRDAERAAGEAGRELAHLDASLARARERAEHLRERIDDLRSELITVQAEAAKLDGETSRLERERTDAAARALAAARAAEKARGAVER